MPVRSSMYFYELMRSRRFLTITSVVLFDESDVFLEERSQADLRRNALVSIFLRTLEYYDGILVLTSNRGRFLAAFT